MTQTRPADLVESRGPALGDRALPWLTLLLLCALIAPTGAWLWHRWTLGIWYSAHGLAMPFIVAYLVLQSLRDDADPSPYSSAWGFAVLVPCILVLALDSVMGTQLLSALALVSSLPGLSLLLLGVARTRRLIFPLILAGFMLPIPAGFVSSLHLLLRQISAWGVAKLVPIFQIPILVQGTTVEIPSGTVIIADACSGFSTLYASLAVGLILAHRARTPQRMILLVASAVLLSLLCNMVRVTILILLINHYGLTILDTPIHEISGVATFGVVLIVLLAIGDPGALRRPAS